MSDTNSSSKHSTRVRFATFSATGFQVSGALHPGRQLDPARLEAERVQLGAEDLADLAHARGVERSAVDAHRALEELQRFRAARLHRGDDALLGGVELGEGGEGEAEEGGSEEFFHPSIMQPS